MTELLNVEFVDELGVKASNARRDPDLHQRGGGCGDETTARLIGWAAKVLTDHPDQRRGLAQNPSLIPWAVEELLRCEPPAPHVARYVTRDVSYYELWQRPGIAPALAQRYSAAYADLHTAAAITELRS